nr:hypothetical protein [Tanacetum cinerariifolium]
AGAGYPHRNAAPKSAPAFQSGVAQAELAQ